MRRYPVEKDLEPIVVSGTDTYTATLLFPLIAYTNGRLLFCKFTNANTGASTINIGGLGAKSIKKVATALSAGDIEAGGIYVLVYDGTNFQIIGVAGAAGPGGSGEWGSIGVGTGIVTQSDLMTLVSLRI